ncbi:MAG TPA: hypothetical protein VFG06_03225 [Thermodesulfovibrionales bacterium]|nr:hypothetical protein [Thermodesulfovibrionales bacterium]
MKRGIMKTALSVFMAAVVALCISLPAYAMSGEFAGTSLLFTYYDVRSTASGGLGLTDNYFTVTNTATDRWVQAHVRVRTGAASIELLDFDILMSPTDVFTFDLYEDNGATVFASCDTKTLTDSGFTVNYDRDGDGTNDCFVLDSSTFPAMLSLITTCRPDLTGAEVLGQTKKGYVEIIGEGTIWACSTNKNKCWSECEITDLFTLPGKLLEHCTNSDLSISDVCPMDVDDMDNVLIGRQYYATVSSGVVTRFTQLNAEVMDDYAPLLLHCEDFTSEVASNDCQGQDQGSCFAYVAATTNSVASGADDMNHCMYTSKILVANDVANKFGAGATFGPTIADIQYDNPRNGTLLTTAQKLEYIMQRMNKGYSAYNGSPYENGNKQYADSHYFAVPAPNAFDLSTSFAFIFPLQHFIGEKNIITTPAIWDNEENKQTLQLGKFLSPGLPSPISPGDEAALFKLNAPFAEGWIRFAITATNSTTGCTESVIDLTSCEVAAEVTLPTDSYVPAYTGAVFNTGANHISASHFQFTRDGLAGN